MQDGVVVGGGIWRGVGFMLLAAQRPAGYRDRLRGNAWHMQRLTGNEICEVVVYMYIIVIHRLRRRRRPRRPRRPRHGHSIPCPSFSVCQHARLPEAVFLPSQPSMFQPSGLSGVPWAVQHGGRGRGAKAQAPPQRLPLVLGRQGGARQDLAQQVVDAHAAVATLAPLLGIAQADFLEARVVAPVGAADVQVAAHHHLCVEALVPVVGQLGAAPRSKARHQGDGDQVLAQRPVVDDDQLRAQVVHDGGGQLGLEAGDEVMAPLDARGIGVVVQQVLVRGHDVLLGRPADGVLLRDVLGSEAVVVQREDGRNHTRPARAPPHHKVVLGRQHAHRLRNLHALQVLGLAAPLRLALVALRQRVQLVVARHPPHLREARHRPLEPRPQLLLALAHVAAEDEPVVGVCLEEVQFFAVDLVREMQVGDGPQAPGPGRRRGSAAAAAAHGAEGGRSFLRASCGTLHIYTSKSPSGTNNAPLPRSGTCIYPNH